MLRSEDDGWFSTGDVRTLYERLRIPQPSNIPRELGRLRGDGLIIRRNETGRPWSVTPLGIRRVFEEIGELDLSGLMTPSPSGAVFGQAIHSTIAPEFSPLQWNRSIHEFLQEFPFDQNVFLMTRFPDEDDDEDYLDPIADVIDCMRSVLDESGLVLHLASDRLIVDTLFGNVAAHMWAARYGIALLENRTGEGLNYNVMTELGAMLMTGRRCALLKDLDVDPLPIDLAGYVYKPVDLGDTQAVAETVGRWITDDLRRTNT